MKNRCIFLLVFLYVLILNTSTGTSQTMESHSARHKQFDAAKITFTLNDSWFGRDKVHHFLASAFIATSAYYFSREQQGLSNLRSQQIGIGFSFSLGLLKEIRDGRKTYNSFSVKDLVADILGTAFGVLLVSD